MGELAFPNEILGVPQREARARVFESNRCRPFGLRSLIAEVQRLLFAELRQYWKKADLPALEEALMYYRGGAVFERRRNGDTRHENPVPSCSRASRDAALLRP